MYKECRHIFPDGSRCHAAALKDMPYCYHHDRIHRALLRQRSSKAKLDLPALEDRGSILVALSQVIGALADGRLDTARTGQLLYGFQVAAQFASIIPKSAAGDSVDSLTRTRDGQELGPEKIKCFEGDDCETCPYLDECGGEVVGEQDEDDDDGVDEDEDGDDEEDADGEEEQEDGAEAKVPSRDTA